MNEDAGGGSAESRNPYSPPSATVTDSATVNNAPRPIAIPLLQATALLAIVGLITGFYQTISLMAAIGPSSIAAIALLTSAGLRVLVFLLLIWMVIGLQRRWQSGRWLGVLWLAALVLSAAVVILEQIRTSPPQESAYLIGLWIGFAIIAAPLALLAHYSAFSAKARAYFGRPG